MKLTAREKIMLIVLCLMAFLAASYYLVITPQLSKLDRLTEEHTNIQAEVEKAKAEIDPDNRLHKDYEELNKKIEEKTVRFYPTILQDKLVVTLDDMIGRTEINVDSIAFSPVSVKPVEVSQQDATAVAFPMKDLAGEILKTAGDADNAGTSQNAGSKAENAANPVEEMSATLQYSGDYDQLVSFIKEVEALNRTVVIKSLAAGKGEDDMLTGSILLEFYALPKIHKQDNQYFEWPYQNAYGKDNPFR